MTELEYKPTKWGDRIISAVTIGAIVGIAGLLIRNFTAHGFSNDPLVWVQAAALALVFMAVMYFVSKMREDTFAYLLLASVFWFQAVSVWLEVLL